MADYIYLGDHLRLSTRLATLAETPRVSTWLRQIYCEAFEIAKRAMDQGTIVGGTQDHPGRLVCIESFLPAGRTQAPAISGFEARKAKLG